MYCVIVVGKWSCFNFLSYVINADEKGSLDDKSSNIDRRKWLVSSAGLLAVSLGSTLGDGVAMASKFADSNLFLPFLK